jgi:MtN3 and saliva related transmembrane protein
MIAVVIGISAAVLSIASFLPQAWRIIRTRKTAELATTMWVLNVVAYLLWTAYGAELDAWAIIIPNALCMVFSAFILVMKLVPPKARHAIADVLDPTVDAAAVRRNEIPAPKRDVE